MFVEREQLENQLNILFSKYANNSVIKDKIKEEFIKRNISISDALDIITKRIDLRIVSENILYLVVKALFNSIEVVDDKSKINPNKWFTEKEIAEYDKYREENEEIEIETQIIFDNVIMKKHDYFVASNVQIQTLVKLLNNRSIKYNPNTQRKTKLSKHKGFILEQIDVDNKQVKEITESILAGEQFPNFLILNLLQDGSDEFEFKKNKSTDAFGTLVIKSGEIDALDGFHRMLASIHALQKNPELDFSWGIIIVNYDESKARRFMVQEQKGRKMGNDYIASLDINRLENLTVKKINENSEYDFYKKIVSTEEEMKVGLGWTKFSIMEESIVDVFTDELNSKADTNRVANMISKGLGEIIGANVEQFIDKNTDKSVINHKNIYPLYIYLIKKVIDTPNWEDKIYNVISIIDFTRNNNFWIESGVINPLNKDIAKINRVKLYNYIDDKLKEVL